MQKKNGVSLIVLVIVIIVMIILAATVVISLNNNGIIGRANTAVRDYNEQEVFNMANAAWSKAYVNNKRTEQQLTEEIYSALDKNGVDRSKYVIIVTTNGVDVHDKEKWWVQDRLSITKGNVTLEAGDLIQYNSGVQGYKGAWKVLGAEDGKLLIISTQNVNNAVYLYGLEGDGNTTNYGMLNGISRLNSICSVYGKGIGAVGARSIKVEDVDKLTGFDKTKYSLNTKYEYGNKMTFSWDTTNTDNYINYTSTNGIKGTLNRKYKKGFSYVDFNTMIKTKVEPNENKLPTLTISHYYYSVASTNLPTISLKATEMLFGEYNSSNKSYPDFYWLASPYIGYGDTSISFGIRHVFGGYVLGNYMFTSAGGQGGDTTRVRAVVELSPNIKIGEKDNTLGWSYTI